ncbi:hypothetical protein Acaty_m0070 (plasmid) [Acidithiobacillus caldus ATCC 51756]|uniref:Uncharacterized protein n=1 Tax=Acidithiobacillus caldus (strain ATCC 51756 / DSM 8584 / KU) TaxID=637389 RepID=A0A059ZYW3_ACICK|nr:hypothetical protein Acaty_m0070 [Acidithiobacillus caldus ATCC 51756]
MRHLPFVQSTERTNVTDDLLGATAGKVKGSERFDLLGNSKIGSTIEVETVNDAVEDVGLHEDVSCRCRSRAEGTKNPLCATKTSTISLWRAM